MRWEGKLAPNGLRLSVLLHADSPSGSPHLDFKVDLVESLKGVLNQLPCQSIKLVAFNLDRQEEIFRQEQLDSRGFAELQRALDKVELVTIPYQSLERDAWRVFVVQLAHAEVVSKEPVDAVVILGSWGSHVDDKLPKDMVNNDLPASHPPFFYLKFGGSGSRPDGLERLIKDLHGYSYDVYSPETLAQVMQKILARILRTEMTSPRAAASSSSQ